MRGQSFSFDLVLALLLATITLGAIMHAMELPQRAARWDAQTQPIWAQSVADGLAQGTDTPACAPPTCCVRYSNETDACPALSCPRHVLTAKRLIDCAGAACLLEVRTCA
jgi:hypothetical protein